MRSAFEWLTTVGIVVFVSGVAAATACQADTVSGRVWIDVDGDGRQGSGEPGLADVRVELVDAYGRSIEGREVRTDEAGTYRFDEVPVGAYRVAFERPVGFHATRTDVGSESNGVRISMHDDSLDSDVNERNGHRSPARRGPHSTGIVFEELTRIDASGDPWPVNAIVFYPTDSSGDAVTVGELHLGDTQDRANLVAIYRFVSGIGPLVQPSNPDLTFPGILAIPDAPVRVAEHPVVVLEPGIFLSMLEVASLGDHLASHGYVAVCTETTAIHGSVALGSRLQSRGGPYAFSDFDHIPRISGSSLQQLLQHGYEEEGYITCHPNLTRAVQEATLEADGAFLLDQLETRNATPGDAFEGRLDFTRVGYLGYSMSANRGGRFVENDPRVGLGISLDSAEGLRTDKPFLWIGKRGATQHAGPKLTIDFVGDSHPLYVEWPSVRLIQDVYANVPHEQLHIEFGHHYATAFFGLFLSSINGYRRDLGVDGDFETFGGIVGPHSVERFPALMTERFEISSGSSIEADAGWVADRMIGWDPAAQRLVAVDAAILSGADWSPEHVSDLGRVTFESHGVHRTVAGVEALACDVSGGVVLAVGGATSTNGSRALLRLDRAALESDSDPIVAQRIADLSGVAPRRIVGLTTHPASGQLFAIVSADGASAIAKADRLVTIDPETGRTRKIGALLGSGEIVSAAAGLAFDSDATLLVADRDDGHLVRVDPATGAVIEIVDTDLGAGPGPVTLGTIARDDREDTLVFVDTAASRMGVWTLEQGNNTVLGDLADLGVGALGPIDFTRGPYGLAPQARIAWADATSMNSHTNGSSPSGILGSRVVVDGIERAAGGRLLARWLDRTAPIEGDIISIGETGPMRLGAAIAFSRADDARIFEAIEVLHRGETIGWIPSRQGGAIGGRKWLPLEVLLSDDLSAEQLEDVIEALGVSCVNCPPSERVFEVRIEGPAGDPGEPLRITKTFP